MKTTGSGASRRGADARRIERRVVSERRRDVRWEPGKKIRRDGKDRRATGVIWDKPHGR